MKLLHKIGCAAAALTLAASVWGASMPGGFAAAAEDGNLALGKTAWMSAKNGQTNNVKLTDGIHDTSNVNYTRENGAAPRKPWFLVDLGAKTKFNQLVIKTGSQAVAAEYSVWFSNFEQTPPAFNENKTQTENGTINWGEEWTQAVDRLGDGNFGALNQAKEVFTTPIITNLPEEGARYVLIVLVKQTSGDTRIGEIEIYMTDTLRVTSGRYAVDQEQKEITVLYSHTDIATVKANLDCDAGIEFEIYESDGITPATVFAAGCVLKVWETAAPETVKTYTMTQGDPSGNTTPVVAAGQGRTDGGELILSDSACKTAETFAAAVSAPEFGTYTVLRRGEPAAYPLQTGDVVQVTAENGTTADYTVRMNLALGKPVEASAVYNNNPSYGADKAVDGDSKTSRWATPNGTTDAWLRVDLGESTALDQCVVREYGADPGIREYTLEYSNDETVTEETVWTPVTTGSEIGKEKIIDFEQVSARHVRLSLANAVSAPTIYEFELYCLSNPGGGTGETSFGNPTVQDGKIAVLVQEGNSAGTACQIAAALYDGDTLKDISFSERITTVLGEQTLSVQLPALCKTGDVVKVFIWNSLDDMVPLTETKEVPVP